MIVGERIRERLQETHMSQSELARRVELTQPAINALIRGSSRTSLHLHRIARELGTTPAYLSGEVDDPEADAPPAPEIDAETRELMEQFMVLAPADRRAVIQIVKSMNGSATGRTVQSPARHFRGEVE